MDNYVTFADNFGKQIEHWNGVDITRERAAATPACCCRAASSTGRTSTDNCEVRGDVPEIGDALHSPYLPRRHASS